MTEESKAAAPSPEWTEDDEKWMQEHVHVDLHQIAKRYGRRIFSLTMQNGQTIGAFVRIMQARPPQHIIVALQVIERNYNYLLTPAIKGLEIDPQLVVSCKEDIERLAVIRDGGPATNSKETKSGIILPS